MAVSRRRFMQQVVAGATALAALRPGEMVAQVPEKTQLKPIPAGTTVRWLDGAPVGAVGGATLGVPWPRGALDPRQPLTLLADGLPIPTQSWPLAYWPDGSLKWTGHAVAGGVAAAKAMSIGPGEAPNPQQPLTIQQDADAVEVDTGPIRCRIPRSGSHLITAIHRGPASIIANARLVVFVQDQPGLDDDGQISQQSFTGQVEKLTVEQSGPVRAVIRLDGRHVRGERKWLPFTIRLYFYAGSDAVRLMHTFIFDGDESRDFIRGLGVRFDVPLRDPLYDRHVRFAGEGDGLWAEAVQNLSGLRRDPGGAFIDKQLAGEACPPLPEMADAVRSRLQYVPAWDSFRLSQTSPDAFAIRKKTAGERVCWIDAARGGRASGLGYVGGPTGGAAFGVRDFWQKHPAGLDIRGAASSSAQVTMWLWSPDGEPMDLRFYHDGMGQDTHEKQRDALEITYEDYEPGFATAHGIARTSEMTLWALSATPSRKRLTELAAATREPAVLVCPPEHYHACGVFGAGLWSLPDRSTPQKARIEDQLDWNVDYYAKQVDQHRWYGFWDYGDVMHTYDGRRHCWRYDVGGYAWDNSELSPDLWLWYSFLRSGDARTFRLAEAMTRHTGEVDVYHLGRFAGLGTRHNVRHWGCSAKQLRISTAVYRRFYYYLTADERTGDLMRELVDCDRTFLHTDPGRKLRTAPYQPRPEALAVGIGTDWGSVAAALLTEWERTGDARYRDKLLTSLRTIGKLPFGFFTGGLSYDLATGAYSGSGKPGGVSHLSSCFGLPEICAELIQLMDVPEFAKAWLDYCAYYSADRKDREAALGFDVRSGGLVNAHSRLTAFAARHRKDAALAKRAWQEFVRDDARWAKDRYTLKTTRVTGPDVLRPIDEAAWVGTNDTSQWSLAAIQNLALVGDQL